MKPNIIHSIVVCLAAFALPFMVACSSSQEDLLPENTETVLYLNIEPIGQTRAGTAELPDNEKMRSLRIVVLHEDMTVEHNRYYRIESAQDRKLVMLKVTPNEKKKIYLFANEESVSIIEGVTVPGGGTTLTGFFNSYPEDVSGFETAVNNLYFAPDYSDGKVIPMSSVYEIDFKEGREDHTFYLVRVATKFMINFTNWRGEDVKVKSLSIASHAVRNFLMARVGDYPLSGSGDYPTWIDWLKAVSDASNINSEEATSKFGWLTDYALPETEQNTSTYYHEPVTVKGATMDKDNPADSQPGKAENAPVFYLPESKNTKKGVTDDEQEYTLTIDIEGVDKPFVQKLNNLNALFRNTNLVVNITMYHNLELSVDVLPFTYVPLDPDFGLEREDFTGYIVGKDDQNRDCWYDGTGTRYYLGPTSNHGGFVSINGKEYLLVYADYERTAAQLDHIFEKGTRKKYLLDPTGRTGYSFTLNPDHPEWGADIYYNKHQMRVWLNEDYNEWTVGVKWDAEQQKNVEAWFWQVGTTWYRTLNEWDRLNWNQAIYWNWTHVYPKYWFDVLGNRYPWSEGDTKEKRKNKLGDWVDYLE